MIKIIKSGTLREVTCNNCGAVLRYDTTEDIKTEDVKSFLANCVEILEIEANKIANIELGGYCE